MRVLALHLAPELGQRALRCGMHPLRRDLRRRAQHVRSAQQVGARQHESRFAADAVVIQENVEVHGARRPLGRITPAAAGGFRLVQALDHRVHRQVGGKAYDEVDEIVTGEADGRVGIGA
jgi:hypothetical protein